MIMNHAFVDGNKRVGHYAMETFLVLNGYEIDAPVVDQETIVLQLASGKLSRDAFTGWIKEHTRIMK
jgi:death-on-curing protein